MMTPEKIAEWLDKYPSHFDGNHHVYPRPYELAKELRTLFQNPRAAGQHASVGGAGELAEPSVVADDKQLGGPPQPVVLPCPFCGAEASIEECEGGSGLPRFSVGCDSLEAADCMGYQSFTTFDRRGDAVRAWNRRAAVNSPLHNREGILR